jgi:NSS family neurotransmitter:Na+ symporter
MSNQLDDCVHQRFSTRIGFLLCAMGIAIGTGNIWRFSRIAAKCGGEEGAGAFLFAWVIFLFLWSIPLIIAEYAIGRKTRSGVIGSFYKIAGEKFAWMGAFVAFVATAITFFYSVVIGWCIYYFVRMATGNLPQSVDSAMNIWNNYQHSPWPLFCHAIVMCLGTIVIWKGVRSIERVNTILMPILFCIVIISLVRAVTLDGAGEGLAYLFRPQWSQLAEPKIWVEALTQNAWDTGAGWGLFITYAAYMKYEHGCVKNAFITGCGNNLISLLSAMTIFGTVFAVLHTQMDKQIPEVMEIMRSSGPASTGLTFIWMPQLFSQMPLGAPLGVLFFIGLSLAGFTSLIAQLELPVRTVVDLGVKRSTAIGVVISLTWLLGIPSAIYTGFLANQDFVWGIALMLSGAFVAFILIRYGIVKIRTEQLMLLEGDWKANRLWDWTIQIFVPAGATILLIWLLYDSAKVKQWYNPFESYSIMTCLMQWSIALIVFLLLNKKISGRLRRFTPDK